MSKKTKRKIIVIILVLLGILFYVNRKHEVVFDTMGGTTIDSVKIRNNRILTKPETPVREGFRFDDWYYDGYVFDFDEKITKDVTLVARWIKLSNGVLTYDVKFVLNEMGNFSTVSVKSEDVCPRPEDPIREGKSFVGWYYNGELFDFNTPITDNIILTAKWQ